MRILAIHNYHRSGSASGDDQVFKAETKLLEENGHKVYRYTVCNDEFDEAGIASKIAMTLGMIWSFKHYRGISEAIASFQPDIVHVHTFFPLLSPSILYAAKRGGCKVVATLHDTRFICPVATSLRNGRICNDCSDGCYIRMAKYHCFKGSTIQSLFVSAVFAYHRIRRSFYKQIDKYICLNSSQIELLDNAGFDSSKVVKKYNFIYEPDVQIEAAQSTYPLPERYVVYYGRIGEEKGIRILMNAWDSIKDIPLVVMGDGPLAGEFKKWAQNRQNVIYLGYTKRDTCLSIVRGAEFVLFPSIWYEGCSMVEIEAESLGKAIVATDIGFSAEIITDYVNGIKFPLGDYQALEKASRALWENPVETDSMGLNARDQYDELFRPEKNYNQLVEIYNQMEIRSNSR